MSLRNVALAFVFAAAVSLGAAGRARAGDDNKCTIAVKGSSPTKQACDRGGRKEAARQMKTMVKTAKAKGTVFVCDDCHKDNESYELNDNARKDFEKLLAALK